MTLFDLAVREGRTVLFQASLALMEVMGRERGEGREGRGGEGREGMEGKGREGREGKGGEGREREVYGLDRRMKRWEEKGEMKRDMNVIMLRV